MRKMSGKMSQLLRDIISSYERPQRSRTEGVDNPQNRRHNRKRKPSPMFR
jgi:hypothetical protein